MNVKATAVSSGKGASTWEQVLRARNFGEVIEAQTRYAQRAYDAHMSEIKVGEMYLGTTRNATKLIEQASKRLS